MRRVYSRCRQVVIWLGERDEDILSPFAAVDEHFSEGGDASDLWARNPALCADDLVAHQAKLDGLALPVSELAGLPWFSRRWVLQEVAMAPHAVVVCGAYSIAWTTLANAVRWMVHARFNHSPGYLSQRENPTFHTEAVSNIMMMEYLRRGMVSTLFTILRNTRFCKCSDPRDVLYSILGISSDVDTYGDALVPDYSVGVEEVYRRFVVGSLVEKGSLAPLDVACIPPDEGALDLPSWVQDFSKIIRTGHVVDGWFSASGRSKLRLRFSDADKVLHAFGLVLDVIKRVNPWKDPEEREDQSHLEIRSSVKENGGSDREEEADAGRDTKGESEEGQGQTDQETGAGFEEDGNDDFDGIEEHSLARTWFLSRSRAFAFPNPAQEWDLERWEQFARTMVMDRASGGERVGPGFAQLFRQYVCHYTGAAGYSTEDFVTMDSSVLPWVPTWFLSETESGRFGRVLEHARAGDLVCVLDGAEMPYVIRRCGDGRYRFVCACYVHGLMYGEAFEAATQEHEELTFI
ncbi:hypothetical protein BDY21DRAFT_353477 [Lineolata rhizophorae]|uniref:Heterokaryon incompatibility domain-containing protein n=1 Tax=Lineolata rhizophorae TaxID=578093 RepID=A0A6A6NSN2_9PEZI|nr:hypothetical protein BDY21DRAFT_353477 [Lineolata rhizophorae]